MVIFYNSFILSTFIIFIDFFDVSEVKLDEDWI